jgi:hypothetical protein
MSAAAVVNFTFSALDTVGSVLGVERSEQWGIDELNGLAMVTAIKSNFTPDFPASLHVPHKGEVIDLEKRKVIVPFYGEVHTEVSDTLAGNGAEGNGTEGNGAEGTCAERQKRMFQMGFEGTILRVFKNKGTIYVCTARRLDCSKSRWGTKKSFRELFTDLGGDEIISQLFDAEKLYSPHCHFFVLNHPELLIASKQPLTSGMLVYLGCYSTWDKSTGLYDEAEVDWDLKKPICGSSFEECQEKKLPYEPKMLNEEEAQKHLTEGFHPGCTSSDPRTTSGEFVIEVTESSGTSVPLLKKISSVAYDYRCKVRGDEPNVLHRFYHLIQDAKMDQDGYDAKYAWLTYEQHYETKKRAEGGKIISWEVGMKKSPVMDEKAKLENICKNILLAVPLWRQAAVANYYFDYKSTQVNVINWLTDVYYQRPEEKEVIPRGWKLLELAVAYAKTRKVEHVSAKLLKKNLSYLMENERGDSLYKLRKNMNQMRNKPKEQEKDQEKKEE